jgi:hypothetical protein
MTKSNPLGNLISKLNSIEDEDEIEEEIEDTEIENEVVEENNE